MTPSPLSLREWLAAGGRFAGAAPLRAFDDLPDDLATLSDDELNQAIADRQAIAERLAAGDEELVGDAPAGEVVEEMTRGVEQIEALRAEQATRAEQAEEVAGTLDELARRARGETDDPAEGDAENAEDAEEPAEGEEEPAEDADDPEAGGEPAADEEPAEEPIAASARYRRPMPRRSSRHEPREETTPEVVITAAADIPGTPSGARLDGRSAIAEAMIARRRGFGQVPAGYSDRVPVATIHHRAPAERVLDADDPDANWRRIQAVVSEEALTAAGPLCAPATPMYDLEVFAVADRPVRGALPRFGADRGGIIFQRPPTLASINTAVGMITAAESAQGGTFAQKTCQVVTCPTSTEVDVNSQYACLQFDNLSARTYPEMVAAWSDLAVAAGAQMSETFLLDQIDAASTQVTAAQIAGAVSTLLPQIIQAAAALRNRHRMNPNRQMRVLLPSWAQDLLVTDMIRTGLSERYAPSIAGLEALLTARNITATYYIDGPTGAAQVFGAQGAGALLTWPPTVAWYLYPEGSFLFLDSGTLDIGLVRDSVLNSTNDYQVFTETFENVAFVGIESLAVTSTVCANGAVGAAAATITCPV